MRKQQLAMEQELAEQNGAACKIQARVRGRGDKRRVAQMREEQTHAAGRIQSIHRGRQGRRQVPPTRNPSPAVDRLPHIDLHV